jgi:hypothetical protein
VTLVGSWTGLWDAASACDTPLDVGSPGVAFIIVSTQCYDAVKTGSDPGCVKTLRGITAPGILGPMVMRRAKKRKNLSSARHYDQIRFRFHTTKTQSRL